ncbi:hypothetical protein J31TS4_19200 [Paenibacillus sp. J31TS4]|uniref:DUF3168 domain-containing protein n=1 Tax=Paenibacillus sp. J31TS4 TaxID=2807195 RepID=UPI001B2742F3|nr:DUF3168 domain-containing protein [Paenibacillus sp. J31TS4]GIP38640.1 hypothetical protein J31TS4_19200 [Paenibacillus sp. J31TS4]
MTSAAFPIQQAIYRILTGDAGLMSRIKGVFDDVPENQAFPYITIGEMTSGPFRTFSRFGEEATITLHIWSRYEGFKEASQILGEVNRLLADKEIEIPGYDSATCQYDFSETLRDEDGRTRHIPVRYRIKLQEL